MSTITQTPKVKKLSKKAAQALLQQTQPETPQINPSPAPAKHKLATQSGTYGGIQVVTSNRLKRRFCNSGYETSLYIPDVNYTQLSIDGLKMGVTVDEVIRGLIEQHLASTDRLNGLQHFVPALAV